MSDNDIGPKLAALSSLEARLHLHKCAQAARAASSRPGRDAGPTPERASRPRFGAAAAVVSHMGAAARCLMASRFGRSKSTRAHAGKSSDARRSRGPLASLWRAISRRPALRIATLATGCLSLVVVLVIGGIWLRLLVGPIALDVVTPWLTAAITQNLGSQYQVGVGGTFLEFDENGRMAIRVRDVRITDASGVLVASAPKAEAGFAVTTLLTGRPKIESINLVGAELAVRIGTDGGVTVFAGAERQPIATAPAGTVVKPADAVAASAPPARRFAEGFAAGLAWLDSLGTFGLDGGALTEIGLKSGVVAIEDQRNGRRSRIENIHVSVTRPQPGELAVTFGSQDPERPWVVVGAVKPSGPNMRALRVEARQVQVGDVLMAARLSDGALEAKLPVSASLTAEIGPDGMPQFAAGRVLFGPGEIDNPQSPSARIVIDRLEATLDWDANRGLVISPLQLVSGPTRITLVVQADAPADPAAPWQIALRGGSVLVSPTAKTEQPLLLDRVNVRARFDPQTKRLDIVQGEAGGMDVDVAVSGAIEFATGDPKLMVGMAARNMSAASFKRIWPPFVNPAVRNWVMTNMSGGNLDRIEIATNAPLSTLRDGGPPVPDDGLSIEIVSNGTAVKLTQALPPIKESDLVMRVRGRAVSIALARGVAEMPSGRRLTVSNGLFDVPDSHGPRPPARVKARVDGPAPAAAEFLTLERIRETTGAPLDPANVRGTVSAQVNVATTIESDPPPGAFTYSVTADITNFAVDKFAMSQKVEAATLKASANQQGYQLKGDVRIGGVPANVDYRKQHSEAEAEVRLQGVVDDAARGKLGADVPGLTGPIPVKVVGRVPVSGDQDNRLAVEADLTQAKIDNPMPGWVKAAGKSAKASLVYVGRAKPIRVEEIVVEGSGAAIRGGVEFDQNGDVATANFPLFGLSDGDRANLKVERAPDGMFKLVVRGDVYDGRAFVKSVLGGGNDAKQKHAPPDFDVDMKIAALAGFNGEALRAVDLKAVRRAGRLESFTLGAKIGGDAALIGDIRGRVGGGGQVLYVETKDAGALFRFTDTYAKMFGGQMWVAIDPPSPEQQPKEGLLNVRDFVVRGESSLDNVAGGGGQQGAGVEFSRMRVEFAKSPGRLTIREGVVRGPVVGATLEGVLDYAGNEVRMRGTFVPLYGLNNAFGQIPIVGLFLGGGSNEGLVGVTYEVVGTPGAPVLRVNPISAVAPGVLRKFFEFPSMMSGANGGGSRLPDDRYPENRMPDQRYDPRASVQ